MNKEEFLANYYCKLKTNQSENNFSIETEIYNSNNEFVDSVKTNINIYETNNWIRDSQSPISITPYNWEIIIEQTIKFQLDFFARRIPIIDFFPLDSNENLNIEEFYRQ